jgi:hypothetical protein
MPTCIRMMSRLAIHFEEVPMRRILGVVTVLAMLATVTIAWRANTTDPYPTLQGAWVVTGWELEGETVSDPQPGLIVFTETHYSIMYVNGADPRTQYAGEEITDAEKVPAYNTITANSGRYDVSGNELTTRAYVAKDPNYMGSWPENALTYAFRLEGEALHLDWPEGWPDDRKGTFRKVEGEPAPW